MATTAWGGFYDAGGPDGLSDVYATWFAFVGLKQTMAGVTLGRYWKKVPITSYATQGTKIQIRLQDIPPLHAELYRISTLPDTSATTSWCGNNNTDSSGVGFAKPSGTIYNCVQPNAYIQLSGTSGILFGHDEPAKIVLFIGISGVLIMVLVTECVRPIDSTTMPPALPAAPRR